MKYYPNRQTDFRFPIQKMIRYMLIAGVLLWVGCDSVKTHYKKGNRYLEEGRYEEAVRELSKAAESCREKDDAPCDLYTGRLEYAKRRAAETHYAHAQRCFAERDLDPALKAVDKAIHYAPSELRYQSYRGEILAAIQVAEQLRSQALALADQGRWDTAIETMQQALGENRSLAGGNRDLQNIKRRAHDHYLNLAQQQLHQGQWDQAIAQANRALSYDRQSRRAKDVITQVNHRREAQRLIDQAKRLLHTGAEPQQILHILETARRLHGSHPELDALLLQGRQRLCDQKLEQAQQALGRKEFHRAFDLLGESKKILSTYGNVDALLQDVTLDLSEWHSKTAARYREQGLPGNALLSYLSAIHYNPNDPQTREGIAASVAQLRQEIQYSMGFVGFRSSWQNRHIAARLETDTVEYLHQIKPPNVSIVARSDLERILRGAGLAIPDIIAMEFRIEPGRVTQVDALLMGQVLERHITTEKSTTQGTSTYQSGARPSPNPAYKQAQANVAEASDELVRAREKLREVRRTSSRFPVRPPSDESSADRKRRKEAMKRLARAEKRVDDAQDALEKAEKRLDRTPRRIQAPILVEYRYPIMQVTKTATLTCFVKMVDSATGEILLAEQITGQYSATDQTVTGDINHNVPDDPLTIAGDDYLTDRAVIAALDKLHHSIRHSLPGHSRRFVILHRKAVSLGDDETAVEAGMKYLFACPVATKKTDAMLIYLQNIAQKRNQDIRVDIQPLLRQYGSVLRHPGRLPGELRETETGLAILSLRNTRIPRGVRFPCRLTAVDGVSVHTLAELKMILSYYGTGEEVSLALDSQYQHVSVDVTLIP